MAQPTAGAGTATGDPERFARAHQTLLSDRSLQFDLPVDKRPEPPAWLEAFSRWLDSIAPELRILFWAVVVLVALAALWALFRRLRGQPVRWSWRRRRAEESATSHWQPEEAPSRALLADADALAERGDYDGAARLLLFRSIEDIESRRPRLVRASLTSRDIAAAPGLPPAPRSAFVRIVLAVERSLFGGRALAEPDWRQCRGDYEIFALSPEWRR